MAESVVKTGEISLNAVRYPIEGMVHPQLLNRFPSKLTTGDYSYDNEQFLSNWIMNDHRGGIGTEEMEESTGSNQCWWSNAILSYKGHMPLPRLATQVKPTYVVMHPNAAGDETNLTPSSGANYTCVDEAETNDADYVSVTNATSARDLYNMAAHDTLAAGTISKITVRCRAAVGAPGQLGYVYAAVKTGGTAYDGTQQTIDNGGAYAWYTEDWATNPQTTVAWTWDDIDALQIGVKLYANTANTSYCSQVEVYVYANSISAMGSIGPFCNFNSELYQLQGTCLVKLNATGDAWELVKEFNTAPVSLIASIGTNLYVFMGDSVNYWYMSTAESFTQTNVTDATLGIEWDSKLFKMDADGNWWYTAAPNSATPSWTDADTGGGINIPGSQIERLFLYHDAAGDDIIYCATNSVLKAYDFANLKWIDTKVKLPEHPNGGKGALYWRDAAYLSTGLSVLKYVVGSTGSLTSMGIDRGGGLPAEYNGEIVKFAEGFDEMFAIVDASQVTGTQKSGVYAWDGTGWQCWWASTASDGAMNDIIVSAAYAYRLWFDHAGAVYYIDIPRGIRNPNKLSTFTYASSGVFLSSWFDADTSVYEKLAVRLQIYSKSPSSSETIVVKYRTNRTNTDLDSGWTTLGTISTTGLTEYEFGTSGVGVAFKAIQFRFDLARGSTTTSTPDIQAVLFSYMKLLDQKWGWSFTVNLSNEYSAKTPAQLWSALNTAATTDTLLEFTFRAEDDGTETHYVKLLPFRGSTNTGRSFEGSYALTVIEP